MFNPAEDLNQLVSASANIFRRLGTMSKGVASEDHERNRPKEERQCPQRLCLLRGMPEKRKLDPKFSTGKLRGIYLSNALANGGGKRIQDVYCRGDPFCESIFTILGLVECRDSVSKDGEDSLGRLAGLKGGKERMRCEVFLGLLFVCFQRSVENGYKVGVRGGCGGDGGHGSCGKGRDR